MKLSLLKNPYDDKEECTKVQANIGNSDWMKLYRSMPFHGFQDAFISSLISKFIELTETQLPETHDLDSEEILTHLMARLTLASTDGHRANRTIGTGASRFDQTHSGEKNF